MIAYIDGKLAHKEPTFVVIDVGGVGYHIRISLQTYAALKDGQERCRLFTHLSIREDAHLLFGFYNQEEKLLFEDLIGVSGIGANTALVMLSSLSSSEIKQAIAQEDIATIQSIKGIGAKTAQRTIIELKDKMKKDQMLGGVQVPVFGVANMAVRNEAIQALVMLGIAKLTAEKSVDTILKQKGEELSVEELIKLALR
jgi:holliday junction DNA helicase RuvA